MKLTKGTRPNDRIGNRFPNAKYELIVDGNYKEVITDDVDLIVWLQSKGFV